MSIAVSHETDERPPLDPRFPVPDELESWIHQAMAVAPEHRFRRAADARLIKDHPWLLEIAGEYAADADDHDRARKVWRLARELWTRLGDEEAAERVAEKLDE